MEHKPSLQTRRYKITDITASRAYLLQQAQANKELHKEANQVVANKQGRTHVGPPGVTGHRVILLLTLYM